MLALGFQEFARKAICHETVVLEIHFSCMNFLPYPTYIGTNILLDMTTIAIYHAMPAVHGTIVICSKML